MPLDLESFDVTVAREGIDAAQALETGMYDTYRVTILHADQLVAEQAAPRFAIGDLQKFPTHWATLWCWCALRRIGVSVPEFPLFKTTILDIARIKPPTLEASAVDPTTPPADTGSP